MEKLSVEFLDEIKDKLQDNICDKKLSITYRPTERTLVHMMLPHPGFETRSSTGRKIIFRESHSYNIQLTEEKKNGDVKLINDDVYSDVNAAVQAFYEQINYCLGMYGQVQEPVMQWC